MRSLAVLALMLATMGSSFTGTHLDTSALKNNVSTQNVQSDDSVTVDSSDSEEGNTSEDSDYVEGFFEAPIQSEDEIEDQTDFTDSSDDEDDDYVEPSLEEKYEANMNSDTTNEWWDVPSCEDGDHVWSDASDADGETIKICKRCGQAYVE